MVFVQEGDARMMPMAASSFGQQKSDSLLPRNLMLPRNVSFLLAFATKKDVAVAGFHPVLNVFINSNGFLKFAPACCRRVPPVAKASGEETMRGRITLIAI